MTRISKYISYAEAIKSQTATRLGISNVPGEQELKAMRNIGTRLFDRVREFVGGPLFVSSFFRCYLLNHAIGGSELSQHRKGEAIDIDAHPYGGKTNAEIFDFIRNELEFDQLIWEFGSTSEPDWVHVSLKLSGKNRKQVLRAYKVNGFTRYEPFIQ